MKLNILKGCGRMSNEQSLKHLRQKYEELLLVMTSIDDNGNFPIHYDMWEYLLDSGILQLIEKVTSKKGDKDGL